jgi:cysteinyl-tRNA synthetase
MLRVYDTLRDAKEAFVPAVAGEVKIYACGVTVYDDSHIGHARGAVVFDVIRRYLVFKGWRVTYVRNFTDVDDKIIKRAKEEGVSSRVIAERYIEAYQKDMGALGVGGADLEPKATEHMGEIIELVNQLVGSGHAYASGGDVFFRVAAFEGYGKLSKRKLEELLAGARVEVDERKENPLDFVLWKASKEGEPSWESPWGPGRPGWHIECSAMSQAHLGVTFDIHGGGKDLIFPHHENEIAQSEAATGRPFVRYWLHNGFVNINQEKMSKSLGNFFTIKEVLARFHPEAVRLFLLLTHYRSPIDFSDQNLIDAERARRRVYNLLAEVARSVHQGAYPAADGGSDDATQVVGRQIDQMMTQFEAAMDDDFNTARALGHIFETVRLLNGALQDRPDAPTPELLGILTTFQENLRMAGEVLGLFQEAPEAVLKGSAEEGGDEIEAEISQRLAARKRKDWAEADRIRDALAARGVRLKDRPDGTTDWEWDR